MRRPIRKPGRSAVWLAVVPLVMSAMVAGMTPATAGTAGRREVPSYCAAGGPKLWNHLVDCGWAGNGNTGPRLDECYGRRLVPMGTGSAPIYLTTAGQTLTCTKFQGSVIIEAANVTITNSEVEVTTGTGSNGTAAITVDVGASATIDHVTTNGGTKVHACVWDQGLQMIAKAVDCYGANDGFFTWAATDQPTSGNNFVISDSYIHDMTHETSNGHIDGYQTEGSSYGLIDHNTFELPADADSAIAIWDSRRSSTAITVSNNLITGGGFSVYAEDYSPGTGAPGSPSAAGGFTVTDILFDKNSFSTMAGGCVGKYGVWFTRPSWVPYQGGPTDGWHRLGNVVLETGENIDNGNPHVNGKLCS
jgi:hypothetical protein